MRGQPIQAALVLVSVVLAWNSRQACGQNMAGVSSLPATAQPGSYQRLTGANNPAIEFFGGAAGRPSTAPPRTQITPLPAIQPVTTAPGAKPFSSTRQSSNLSPYLALDVRESSTGLPSYHAFVKPQLDQLQFAQQQQVQNRRLQQQLRTATAVGTTTPGVNGGLPSTGHSTQFFNTGGYYPVRR